ncbi:GTPase [Arenibacter sp. H213]|uniref:GTPase n=2 Tax=Arenibacter antarcticus TaxID=2040469 RepID=A0ABW5VC98_9FLAO|nr:GTPase [Arenibacter sp. H213]
MENTTNKYFVFVYNAKSGLGNALLDGAHKILSPDSYSCSLCSITHGAFSENNRWKEFRESSGIKMEFLHKDEFLRKYADKVKEGEVHFPIIFEVENGSFKTFLDRENIDGLGDQDALIQIIQKQWVK